MLLFLIYSSYLDLSFSISCSTSALSSIGSPKIMSTNDMTPLDHPLTLSITLNVRPFTQFLAVTTGKKNQNIAGRSFMCMVYV